MPSTQPDRFAHWQEDPPPEASRRRGVAVIVGIVAVLALGYGASRLATYLDEEPEAPPELRDDFGYFTPDRLRAGDCFNEVNLERAVRTGDEDAQFRLPALTVIPCDRSHSAEVLGHFDIDGWPDYPSDPEIDRAAGTCDELLDDYAAPPTSDEIKVWYSPPTRHDWQYEHTQGVCIAVTERGEQRSGSIAAD